MSNRALETAKIGMAVPYFVVARWYVKVKKDRKERVRKYLKMSGWRASWIADPTKAQSWGIHNVADAHRLAEKYNAEVARFTVGI